MQIECGSCDYKINQADKLVSHYMSVHALSHFDARHLVRVAEYVAKNIPRDEAALQGQGDELITHQATDQSRAELLEQVDDTLMRIVIGVQAAQYLPHDIHQEALNLTDLFATHLQSIAATLPDEMPEVGVTQNQIDYARGLNEGIRECKAALAKGFETVATNTPQGKEGRV